MPFARLKSLIVPHETIFFNLLEKQAENVDACANKLLELLNDYNDVEKKYQNIKALERDGDNQLHDIYTQLNKTFIVPIDHSDITDLGCSLDDIIDHTDATAKYLNAYGISEPPKAVVQLAQILVKQTAQVKTAVKAIAQHKDFSQALAACVEINKLENEADEVYTRAKAELMRTTDAVNILKHKEILDCLETATDDCEHAANVISNIVMKHS